MIPRKRHERTVLRLLRDFPVVAILGARQVGKTTLAQRIMEAHKGPAQRFDLEDPADLARLEDARLALSGLRGLVVLDEIQLRPDIFPILRVLADRRPRPARFLVLGSASPGLLRQSSETLAGRIAFHTLNGFHLNEVGPDKLNQLWLRGGFPPSFLARGNSSSLNWRRQFIRTFLERDLPQLGVRVPGTTLSRFWSMLAHYHGQVWNSSEFATILRCDRQDRTALLGPAERRPRSPVVDALARERREAPGQVPEGLYQRFRHSSLAPRDRRCKGSRPTPKGRGVLGGIPPALGSRVSRRSTGGVLFLGHALRRGD